MEIVSGIGPSVRQNEPYRWFSDAHCSTFDAIRGKQDVADAGEAAHTLNAIGMLQQQ
jgi:hypothetical protein